MNILDKIVADVREIVDSRSKQIPLAKMRAMAEARTSTLAKNRFLQAINTGQIEIIAEVKRASPSRGIICHDFDPLAIAKDYEAGGAAAISVLTEEKHFLGSLTYLQMISERVKLPLLRKDFTINEYQIFEAACHSASAVLLIAAILSVQQILEFLELTASLGLNALVEVHDHEELDKALQAGTKIIGINNRNLKTFAVDLKTSLELAKDIPDGIAKVSESGIRSRKEIETLQDAGVDAVLIGETLMTQPDRISALYDLRGVQCG